MSTPTPGETVLRRDMFRGQIWTAYPTRVVEASAAGLVLAHWPGVQILVPATWTAWLRGGGEALRQQGIVHLARGGWDLEPWTWHTTAWLHFLLPGRWFSVNAIFDDRSGELRRWYINFQRPFTLAAAKVDTFDLFLDLEVGPDLSPRWKDEAEFAEARRLGVISGDEARQVDLARQEALDLFAARAWPFPAGWEAWRRDPAWPLPVLPT